MSTSINRRRRFGFSAAATALVCGAALAGAGSATAAVDVFAAPDQLTVLQGGSDQAAGNLTYEFENSWNTNASVTFAIAGNDCSDATGIAKAVEFAAAPTLTLSGPTDGIGSTTAGTATFAGTSEGILSSSGTASPGQPTDCETAGITDVFTVQLSLPSSGSATDAWKYTLSNIAYNIGTDTPVGPINVTATGTDGLGDGTVLTASNATVALSDVNYSPTVVSTPSSTNTEIGTVTFTEADEGAIVASGATEEIVISLQNGALFAPGMTPTINAPTGYTISEEAPNPTASADYKFRVKAPATAAFLTLTVSGLEADTSAVGAGTIVKLDTDVNADEFDAINVIDYLSQRLGGQDRYDTNIAVFDELVDDGGVTGDSVVLASGSNFPDALSSNYLAGTLNTGVLLTPVDNLTTKAKLRIRDGGFTKVYIAGGPAAVSEDVENEIAMMHVDGMLMKQFITVIRVAGHDRYDTNADANFEATGSSSNTVLLANGDNFADALAVGPIAYAEEFPLVLTNGDSLRPEAAAQINQFDPSTVIIAGGTGVVPQSVEAALEADGTNVIRLAGENRVETAVAIAFYALDNIAGFSSERLNLTNGTGYADALSAGSLAGHDQQLILPSFSDTALDNGKTITEGREGLTFYLNSRTVDVPAATQTKEIRALGQTGVTPRSLLKAAAEAIGDK